MKQKESIVKAKAVLTQKTKFFTLPKSQRNLFTSCDTKGIFDILILAKNAPTPTTNPPTLARSLARSPFANEYPKKFELCRKSMRGFSAIEQCGIIEK